MYGPTSARLDQLGGGHKRGFVPRTSYPDCVLIDEFRELFDESCASFRWSEPSDRMELAEVQKYGTSEPCTVDPYLFEQAIELTVAHFDPYCTGHWTQLENLKLDMSGSPGRPYKYDCPSRGEFVRKHPDVVSGWLLGIDAYDLWDCFGKFEVLPLAKAQEKCRLICGAGMRNTLCGAALFEAFNEGMTKGYRSLHSKVGFSKFHLGWNDLVQSLYNDEGLYDEADCKQWDSGMSAYLLHAVYEVRARLSYYSSQQWKLFDSFVDTLCNSVLVLSSGQDFKTVGGNKSGSCNTTTDNCIGNVLCLAYSWLATGREPLAFHTAPIAVYGDDLLTGPFGIEFWTAYRACGIKLPFDRLRLSIPLSEASFLSQHTGFFRNVYVPVPKTLKYLYRACLSGCKIEAQLQFERVWALWLDGFWGEHSDVLYRMACICADRAGRRRPSKLDALTIWLYWEEVGHKRNHYHDACQEDCGTNAKETDEEGGPSREGPCCRTP